MKSILIKFQIVNNVSGAQHWICSIALDNLKLAKSELGEAEGGEEFP